MTEELRAYYRFVKWQRCAACGALPPTEAAHMRVLLSSKTGMLLPRSHKGRAAWSCIPLCKACHLSQHEIGEVRFAEENGLDYGQIVSTLLVRFFVEGERE